MKIAIIMFDIDVLHPALKLTAVFENGPAYNIYQTPFVYKITMDSVFHKFWKKEKRKISDLYLLSSSMKWKIQRCSWGQMLSSPYSHQLGHFSLSQSSFQLLSLPARI